jgi:uncharacterized protein YndB with AHSA1/START domain
MTANDAGRGGAGIVYECELAHPPAKVWRALTEPGLVAAWLAADGFRAEQGHRFSVPLGPADAANDDADDGAADCAILELLPPHRMRLAWRLAKGATGDPVESEVSLELTALEGGRTWLRIVHSGLAVRATAAQTEMLRFHRTPATPSQSVRLAA